ncbi:hypothetical protein QBZ16_005015 [Prototheca wickerhamii]|uniref:Uncharacterized protein n=1 Tax=Prototheca wickerhamii TaxID=3111 RepID=A0AAD9IEF2_PROWI|nr:hypothetical protein QBZ16_005015 [Prototheca wickerhamii]
MSSPAQTHATPAEAVSPSHATEESAPPSFLKRLSAVPNPEEAKDMHFDVVHGREEVFEGIERAAAAAKKLVRRSLERISGHRSDK